jgi:hypothetical protein
MTQDREVLTLPRVPQEPGNATSWKFWTPEVTWPRVSSPCGWPPGGVGDPLGAARAARATGRAGAAPGAGRGRGSHDTAPGGGLALGVSPGRAAARGPGVRPCPIGALDVCLTPVQMKKNRLPLGHLPASPGRDSGCPDFCRDHHHRPAAAGGAALGPGAGAGGGRDTFWHCRSLF